MDTNSLAYLWTAFLWFGGISTTITLAIGGWILKVHARLQIGETIQNELKTMASDVSAIKKAFVGDYEKPGLITKHYDLEKRVLVLEETNGK